MTRLFHVILIQPLVNLLVWFYNVIPGHDLGVAIIVLTVVVRLVLYPSFSKSLRSQKELSAMQPRLDEIKEKHKDNKEAQTKAILEFYKENKINPLSSCLQLLIQLPILIALYQVFLYGLNGKVAAELYSFVQNPGAIDPLFFNFVDLSKPNLIFGILAGAFQFIQSKMMMPKVKPKDQMAAAMNAQLVYFMPLITILISPQIPAALALYWIVTTVFAIGQQYYIMKQSNDRPATGNN